MIIHYTPCGTRLPAKWTQPKPDAIRCEWRGRVYECDFSDPGIEYEIPESVRDVVHKAWRESESGPLHLAVPSLGPLSEDVTVDHGTEEALSWSKPEQSDNER